MNARFTLHGLDLTPLPYESMESVGARLAWRNGKKMQTLVEKAQQGTKSWLGIVKGQPTDIGAIAQLCGWHEASEQARRLTIILGFDDVEWLRMGFRFCPICLEGGYHSYLYDWEFIQTCPMHGCLLTSDCQECGTPVPWMRGERTLFKRGYRCVNCGGHLAGTESNMAEHLALRAHAALIEERLRPIEQYAAQVLEHVSLVRETRNAFESMQCDRLRHWCCPDVVRRVGVHIRQEMGTRSGAAAYDGLVHLAWERKLSKLPNVIPDTRDARAAAMESMQAVYRVCLRKLERWLFGDNDRFAGVAAACSRFSDPLDDGGLISDWQSSELAYVVLRHALEGNQFTPSAIQWCPRLSHFIVQLDPWLREFRMIRAALVAYIWGLYSIIHSLVCDHQHWQVQDLFEGTGFAAERFVPIYRPKHAPPYLSGSGATLFPLIDGMPLWPFVRPNKPLVEIEAPQGGEQNILPVAKPSRRSWRYQRKPAPAKRRGDESLVI